MRQEGAGRCERLRGAGRTPSPSSRTGPDRLRAVIDTTLPTGATAQARDSGARARERGNVVSVTVLTSTRAPMILLERDRGAARAKEGPTRSASHASTASARSGTDDDFSTYAGSARRRQPAGFAFLRHAPAPGPLRNQAGRPGARPHPPRHLTPTGATPATRNAGSPTCPERPRGNHENNMTRTPPGMPKTAAAAATTTTSASAARRANGPSLGS